MIPGKIGALRAAPARRMLKDTIAASQQIAYCHGLEDCMENSKHARTLGNDPTITITVRLHNDSKLSPCVRRFWVSPTRQTNA